MSRKSRDKGARGEREFKSWLESRLNVTINRNYDQWAHGGFDLSGLDNCALEIKRYAKGNLFRFSWWQQVVESAGDLVPILAYRFDNEDWNVVCPLQWLMGERVTHALEMAAFMPAEEWVERYRALKAQERPLEDDLVGEG